MSSSSPPTFPSSPDSSSSGDEAISMFASKSEKEKLADARVLVADNLNSSAWFQQQQYWDLQAQQLKSKMLSVLLPEVQTPRGKRKPTRVSRSSTRSPPSSDTLDRSECLREGPSVNKASRKIKKKTKKAHRYRREPGSPLSPQTRAALDAFQYLEREKDKLTKERSHDKLRILSEEAMLDAQAQRRSIMSIAAILN